MRKDTRALQQENTDMLDPTKHDGGISLGTGIGREDGEYHGTGRDTKRTADGPGL